MKTVQDFFNKLAGDIDSRYFPTVKYYRDDKNCTKAHYAIELFNNGCLAYGKLISKLSKACNESPENMELIVSRYIQS